jgi:hypothetical protein
MRFALKGVDILMASRCDNLAAGEEDGVNSPISTLKGVRRNGEKEVL